MSEILTIDDLAVSFRSPGGSGERRAMAVDGMRFSLQSGQCVAVVGESGCGKSVTAMSVLRLLPEPSARYERGAIRFTRPGGEAVDLLKLRERELRRVRGGEIAMIFQEPMTSLNPVYTVGDQLVESIALHQKLRGKAAVEAAVEAMERVGIRGARTRLEDYPHQYSGGMRQRVMIAMALACEPSLLIADEPTTALDVTVQARILELLDDLRREREMSMLLITHDLGIVAERADAVCVVYGGRVVEFGPVREVFADPLHPYTRGLFACIPRMGEARGRLTTVSEVIGDASEFTRLPGAGDGVRPWWPWHEPPRDFAPGDAVPREYTLGRFGESRWVGVWRTEATASFSREIPSFPAREPSASASGSGGGR